MKYTITQKAAIRKAATERGLPAPPAAPTELAAYVAEHGLLDDTQTPTASPKAQPTPTASPKAAPPALDDLTAAVAAALAPVLAQLQQPPALDESRVIELIREHAPQAVSDRLLER